MSCREYHFWEYVWNVYLLCKWFRRTLVENLDSIERLSVCWTWIQVWNQEAKSRQKLHSSYSQVQSVSLPKSPYKSLDKNYEVWLSWMLVNFQKVAQFLWSSAITYRRKAFSLQVQRLSAVIYAKSEFVQTCKCPLTILQQNIKKMRVCLSNYYPKRLIPLINFI